MNKTKHKLKLGFHRLINNLTSFDYRRLYKLIYCRAKLVFRHPIKLTKRDLRKFKRLYESDPRRATRLVAVPTLALLVIILGSLSYYNHLVNNSYILSSSVKNLIGQPDKSLLPQFNYDSKSHAYYLSKSAIKSNGPEFPKLPQTPNSVTKGATKLKNLFSLKLPTNAEQGITTYDNSSNLSFTMIPEFSTYAGKQVDNHTVYPIGLDGAKMIYTIKANGAQEDIVYDKAPKGIVKLKYELKLPSSLQARMMPGGNIGIYSANPALFGNISYGSPADQLKVAKARQNSAKNNLVFVIPALKIITSKGQIASSSNDLKLSLSGSIVTITAKDLDNLKGPISIDPSIIVVSISNWQQGNNEGDIYFDSTNNQITEGSLTGGTLASTWNPTSTLSTAVLGAGIAVYDGYVYEVGGETVLSTTWTSTVQYAQINSNGTLGTWNTTTSLPITMSTFSVAYNGYIYALGGLQNGSTALSVVYYALINANGILGTWNTTTSLPALDSNSNVFVYNDYIYDTYNASQTVWYAQINSNGTLGTWNTTTALTVGTSSTSLVAYNGYAYILGGQGAPTAAVYYAPINANGTLGTWNTTTSLPAAVEINTAVIIGGYIYEIGGANAANYNNYVNIVYYAQINANGTLGTWNTTTSLPNSVDASTSFAYNGYIYEIGGYNGASSNVVDYAQIISPGTVVPWLASGNLPTATYNATSVVNNGFVYQIGGNTGSATAVVDYSAITSTGALAAPGTCAGTITGYWCASTTTANGNLPVATYWSTSVVNNGFVYQIGGYTTSATAVVNYAAITSTGALAAPGTCAGTITGYWCASTSTANGSLPTPTYADTSTVSGGYLYQMGGDNTSATTAVVDYSAITSTGALAAPGTCAGTITGYWCASTSTANGSLPTATYADNSVVYNGYLYQIAGDTGSATAVVDYSAITSTGALAAPGTCAGTITGYWCASTSTANGSLPTATYDASSVVNNGFVYFIGGYTTSATAVVDYAALNNGGPGTLGTWTPSTVIPSTGAYFATSVAYNGYIYEIGGNRSSALSAIVDYAPINSNGTVGSWIAATSLPAANDQATSVVYNGYLYDIGGQSSSIYYDNILSTGALGASWTSTTGLPGALANSNATSVVYNGYLYEIGGYTSSSISAVSYDNILSTGALGASWTTATSLPTGISNATSVVYNGYLYEIGGCGSTCPLSTVYYSAVSSNGSIGSWTATTSLPTATDYATSVAYNGYLYEIGGNANSSYTARVYIASINTNGTISKWTATTGLPTPTDDATSVAYNGYLYELGGYSTLTTVDVAGLQSIPRIGRYSTLLDLTGSYGNGTLNNNWNAATSLSPGTQAATSVVYNGYIYEIGGYTTTPITSVYYASISSNGTIGTWNSTVSLPAVNYVATSVVYNGYLYEIGGCTASCTTSYNTVYYIGINSNGTLNTSWSSTGVLPSAIHDATSVVYNGYLYEIGGCLSPCSSPLATVEYSAITSTGAIAAPSSCAGTLTGSWCVSTSTANGSLPTATIQATSVVYNGYIYEIGGSTPSPTSVVDYVAIGSNGGLGTWTATASLPAVTNSATSVVYNGYIYEIGGYNGTSAYTTVDYAPINSNGSLASWTATTSLPAVTQEATSVVYNGNIYELGGCNSSCSSSYTTVEYATLTTDDPTPTSMVINGGDCSSGICTTNYSNPGIGGVSGPGGIMVNYAFATNTCSTFNTETTMPTGLSVLGANQLLTYTTNGCGATINQGRYIWVTYILDDSQTASFPDSSGNHTSISSFTVNYHPAAIFRLRGGGTFSSGSSPQALDTPP